MRRAAISCWMMVAGAGTPWAFGAGVRYTLTDMGLAREGDTWSYARFINDAGQVVATSGPRWEGRGYLWTNGEWVELLPGRSFTGGQALNERGDVLGQYLVNGYWHSFLHSGGTTRILGEEPATGHEYPGDINDLGVMLWKDSVSAYRTDATGATVKLSLPRNASHLNNAGQMLVYVWEQGPAVSPYALIYSADGVVEATLQIPGATVSGTELNELGEAVGYIYPPDNAPSRGFWYHGGILEQLPSLWPDGGAMVWGINNHGVVVGDTVVPDGTSQVGTIWRDGTVTDVNELIDGAPGWHVTRLSDVNDKGVIVAYGIRDGLERAVILTPVPEGTCLWPVGAACVAGTLSRRRKRSLATECSAR